MAIMAVMLDARPACVLCLRLLVAVVAGALAIFLALALSAPSFVLPSALGGVSTSSFVPAGAESKDSLGLAPVSENVETPTSAFWVNDGDSGYRQVYATAAFVGQNCVIYVQDGYPVPSVTVDRLGSEFDANVYPRLTAVFGMEPRPGIDGDLRITILVHSFSGSSLSGYFCPIDVDPTAGETHSNRREMIYLNAATVAAEPENAGSLAAHEFAHLLVYYHDYMLDSAPSRTEESMWLSEGFATFAEHLAGYDGRTDSQLRSFANNPATNLTNWRSYRANYGAVYAFMSYLAAREGQEFITELAGCTADGVAGINQVLFARGVFENFDTLLDDWMVANFLDGHDPEVAPHCYPDIDVAAAPSTITGTFPLSGSEVVTNFGATYLDLPATDRESTLGVVVDGDSSTPLRAALISWDSSGLLPPDVKMLSLVAGDGGVSSPAGYDRHTLAVWARGTVGQEAVYVFRYRVSLNVAGGPNFVDVGTDNLYYPYIAEIYDHKVIEGKEIPPGSGLWYFMGNEKVLRAQFAKMIMMAIGLHTEAIDKMGDPTFWDVPLVIDQSSGIPKDYPYDFVEEAAALGIVNGFGNGSFRPYSEITRGQLVLMITRGANAAGKPLPEYTGNTQVFADVSPSHPFYREIMTAYSAGILEGSVSNDGRRYFYPSSSATRNHVAKMTATLLGHLEGLSSTGS